MKKQNHKNINLSVASLLIVAGVFVAEQASAVPIMINAAKDSHIREDAATSNYGASGDSMNVLGVNGSFRRNGIMSFDLSSFTSDPNFIQFTSVQLQLGAPSQTFFGGTHDVYRLHRDFVEGDGTSGSGTDWNTFDGSTSWQTLGGLGALDSTQIATGVSTGLGPSTPWGSATGLDVTSAANTWAGAPDTTQLGFLVTHTPSTFDGSGTKTYGTKEGSAGPGPGPVLVIEAEFVAPVPEPGTATLLGLAGLAFTAYRRRRMVRR